MHAKNERAKDKKVQRAVLGYDPDVWMETDVQIRDSDQDNQEYNKTRPAATSKGQTLVQSL